MQIAWDEIRREITYKINLAKANWGMKKANEILPRLQEQFEEAVANGDLLALQRESTSWVDDILQS